MIGTDRPPIHADRRPPDVGDRLPNVASLLIGQVRYQLRLLLASSNALVIGIGLPVLLLLASNARHTGLAVSDVAGYAVFGLTVTAWNTHGVSLVAAREAGILKRWRGAPLPGWCYFTGRIVTTTLIAVMAGAITVLAGVLFYGTHLSAGSAAGVLLGLILGAFAWAAAATALTGLIPAVQSAGPIFMITYFPVVIISGVLGPISGLPHRLASLASYLPAQPLADAVTRSLQHAPGAPLLPAHDVAVLASWAIAGLVAAVALFRWEPHRPVQRRAARPAA